MRSAFRAKTAIELKAKIYDHHGWQRARGESMSARIAELYDVSLDHCAGDFVARLKATGKDEPAEQ